MRSTKKVSVWPVGLVGYLRYESPVIKNGKVGDVYCRIPSGQKWKGMCSI